MKILLVATTERMAGATFYARKLAEFLGAQEVSVEQPVLRLLRDVNRAHPDIVHLEMEYATFGSVVRTLLLLPAVVAILRTRRPVVVTFHGVVTRESLEGFRFGGLLLFAFRVSYALASSFASAVSVHSRAMRDTLASDYGVTNVVVIPLGADPAPALPRNVEPHHLAFFGFVRPSKGIEHLVSAVRILMREFPDLWLTIAGGPALEREAGFLEEIRSQVARDGTVGRIVFRTGFLTEEDRAAIALSAEALVLPYTDRYLEVSAVVHDFMAFGIPLVVSDRPRFSELQDGVDCLKVAPEPAAIAEAVRSLFRDASLEERIANALKKESTDFSWARTADRHRRLYESLVDEGTTASGGTRNLSGPP